MNKFNTSIITAVFLISGNVTLTSCTGTIDDIADGLVNGIADQMVDAKGQKEREEKEKQERLNNLLNWVIGSEVDQEAINQFGYDNCFLVTEVPTATWDKVGNDGISPNVDRSDLCLVRCLCYSYSISGYAPHVGGLICNKRIVSDLSSIFRELYEAKYIVVQTDASLAYDKWKLKLQNCTYGYYYNPEEAEAIPMAQQQGLSVVVNSDKSLTKNDIAVRLFKERGFTWGGDEPNGDTNYFSKQ